MRSAFVFVLALGFSACASPPASVQDSGADSAAMVCAVPSSGACEGQTYRFCEGAEVVSLDCSRAGGRCARIEATEFYACLQPVGGSCRSVVPHGSHSDVVFAFCDGANAGCLQDREGGRCVSDLGTCTDADIDTCRGERIISNCRAGQPIAIDCASLGARCDSAARVCVGVALGAPCDRVRRQCAAGTRCQMPRGEPLGVCVAIESDAGTDASSDANATTNDAARD